MKTTKLTLILTLCSFLLVGAGMASAEEKKKTVDPSGTWRWEHEENGEYIKDVLKLTYANSKLTGTYKGRIGPYKIEEAKVDGSDISFKFTAEFDDQKVEIEFEGEISKDEVEGYVYLDFDGRSEAFPWTAERGLKNEDVVGTWNLEIETPEGDVLEPKLTLTLEDDNFEGKFEASDANLELEVSDVVVKEQKLFLTVTGELDGRSLTSKYTLKPQGDKVSGELEYDLDGEVGELEVVGKRKTKKTGA